MAMGNLVVANETPENREVLGSSGLFYPKNDATALAEVLQRIEDTPSRYDPLRASASERAANLYSWDKVVARYEELFASLLHK